MKSYLASKHDEENPVESTPLNVKILRVRALRQSRKREKRVKWTLLVLCCMVMLSCYYILAMPATLHSQLLATMPTEDFEMNFNLLFTVSYFPNMVLPLFGGAIVDKFGEARCILLFCIIIFSGQVLTSLGLVGTSWTAMLAGRLIFGLGAQNLIVANAALISKWFTGKELGVALGLSNVFSYAGVIITNIVSPKVANLMTTPSAFFLGAAVELFALVLVLVIIRIDRTKKGKSNTVMCSPMYSPSAPYGRLDKRSPSNQSLLIKYKQSATSYGSSPGTDGSESSSSSSGATTASTHTPSDTSKVDNTESGAFPNLFQFKGTFWLLCLSFLLIYGVVWSFTNVSSAVLLERDFFVETPQDCVPLFPDRCTSGSLAPNGGNPSFDAEGRECPGEDNVAPAIPRSLRVVDGAEESWHKSEYIFEALDPADIDCHDPFWAEACTQRYCTKQASATENAGVYMSIPYFFTVALTFHLGLLVDKTGWRTELICAGSVLLVLAHALLAFPTSPPISPLVAQGLGYTICVAALWPSVPFTVDEGSVGIAFGIMMCVQNVGLALIPLIVASLYRHWDGHYLPAVELFFVFCSILAVGVGFALMIADKKTEECLLSSPKPGWRGDDRRSTSDDGELVANGRVNRVSFASLSRSPQ